MAAKCILPVHLRHGAFCFPLVSGCATKANAGCAARRLCDAALFDSPGRAAGDGGGDLSGAETGVESPSAEKGAGAAGGDWKEVKTKRRGRKLDMGGAARLSS